MVNIKQSVINTFNRVGISYEVLQKRTDKIEMHNCFGHGSAMVTPLIAACIAWVYNSQDRVGYSVKVSDFDRVRYFVLAEDSNAYMTCLD